MSTFNDLNQNQIFKKQTFSEKMKNFWLKYGDKAILTICIILIALASFEAGFLKGQKNQKDPVMVSQDTSDNCPKVEASSNISSTKAEALSGDTVKSESQILLENQKCIFIGSKNSNKYHLPTCVWAQRIKPENKVCFSSKEDAQNRGYQPAKDCIK